MTIDQQLIALWQKYKDRDDDVFLWGDEVMIFRIEKALILQSQNFNFRGRRKDIWSLLMTSDDMSNHFCRQKTFLRD